jgi:hypothetical protein
MEAAGVRKRWLAVAIVGAALAAPLGYYALSWMTDRYHERMMEIKMVRDTTATVVAREHVRFDSTRHSYISEDGATVERQPGDEEWRVYYQIDNFYQIAEPVASRLQDAETARTTRSQRRFRTVTKEQYEAIRAGDKLNVGWRRCGHDKIEVVSAGKPRALN